MPQTPHTRSNSVGMMQHHLIMAELCLNCATLRMCEVSKQQCIAAEKLDLKWRDEEKTREASVENHNGPSIGGANIPQIALYVFVFNGFSGYQLVLFQVATSNKYQTLWYTVNLNAPNN